MGLVHADIELINCGDLEVSSRGLMKAEDVRRMTVNALVDSGASMMVIPEHIRLQLGLRILGHRVAEYANGQIENVPVAGPIEIRFANRWAILGSPEKLKISKECFKTAGFMSILCCRSACFFHQTRQNPCTLTSPLRDAHVPLPRTRPQST